MRDTRTFEENDYFKSCFFLLFHSFTSLHIKDISLVQQSNLFCFLCLFVRVACFIFLCMYVCELAIRWLKLVAIYKIGCPRKIHVY